MKIGFPQLAETRFQLVRVGSEREKSFHYYTLSSKIPVSRSVVRRLVWVWSLSAPKEFDSFHFTFVGRDVGKGLILEGKSSDITPPGCTILPFVCGRGWNGWLPACHAAGLSVYKKINYVCFGAKFSHRARVCFASASPQAAQIADVASSIPYLVGQVCAIRRLSVLKAVVV